jgi:hypothetical protein
MNLNTIYKLNYTKAVNETVIYAVIMTDNYPYCPNKIVDITATAIKYPEKHNKNILLNNIITNATDIIDDVSVNNTDYTTGLVKVSGGIAGYNYVITVTATLDNNEKLNRQIFISVI